MSGAGALNDAFADSVCPLLDEITFALKAGIPVVAFGCGIGPITNPELMAKLRAVLPRFKLISLRENLYGLPLLVSLGVAREKIHITGDDTIELVYHRRSHSLGNLIGVNLRHSGYAETNEEIYGLLRESLRFAAQALNSSLVSVPISFHESESDVVTNGILLDDPSTGSETTFPTPEEIIDLIGKCRVVVTGSYHAGVFAVAQGIPVVGLVQSPYYEQKFAGLREQFPAGCRILDFRQPVTSDEIQDAIRAAWESAEQVREPLLVAAARQIELSRAAYQTARELIPLEPFD
jgi:colanic acid/amylovoran biosynthesis protein